MRRILFIFILIVPGSALSGFEHREIGSRSVALGGAVTALPGGVWASGGNVGGLSRLAQDEVSFAYSPQPFGLSELNSAGVAFAHRFPFGVTALSVSRYGFELYKEVSTSLSFAKEVRGIGIGTTLHYQSVVIQNYGSAGTIGLDFGILASLSSQFSIGVSAYNLNAPTIGAVEEALAQKFSVGFAYELPMHVIVVLDYQKEVGAQASTCFGTEYRVLDAFALRAGFREAPSLTTGGFGIFYGAVKLDYAITHHGELGWATWAGAAEVDDPPGLHSASSAPNAISPTPPESHSAPAPQRSSARPNSHGAEAWAMRAGIIRMPCRTAKARRPATMAGI